MDGVSLFEPQRMLARVEFEGTLKRALRASGIESERAEALVADSRSGEGHPSEPLVKRDMRAWLERLREGVSRV